MIAIATATTYVPVEMSSPQYRRGSTDRTASTVPVSTSLNADADLIIRAREGDEGAREELSRQILGATYRVALRLTVGNRAEADDLASEAVVRILSSLDTFDTRRDIGPWLNQVVRNIRVDNARYDGRRGYLSLEEIRDTDCDGDGDSSYWEELIPGDDDVAREYENRQRVEMALDCLTSEQREVLVLAEYEGLKYSEIASQLGIPDGTVMSRLHKARIMFRRALGV